VPEDWSVKAVRHACQIDNTLRFPIDAQTRSDIEGKFPYYGPTGILSWINEYRVDGDYFLLGEDGDHFLKFAHQPMTVRVTGKFNVNNHAHVLRGVGECSTDWAATYFKHKDLSPWLIKQGVGRLKLRKETLQTIPVLIPPRTEQSAILAFLDAETAKLDALTAEAERAIELLQERRTALISAAVTGKIDVRGLVATEVL
jgi:type I restriction enzyme S subunit